MSENLGLQLEIRDNSEKAASGLASLASQLSAVKSALSGGLNFENISNQIDSFQRSLRGAIPHDVLRDIFSLGDGLARLQSIGHVKIELSNGATQSLGVEDLPQQVETVSQETTQALEPIRSEVETVAESFQQAGTQAQASMGPVASGVQEVASSLEDMARSEDTALSGTQEIESAIRYMTETGKSEVELLQDRLEQLRSALQEGIQTGNFDDKKITNYALRISELQARIERLRTPARDVAGSIGQTSKAASLSVPHLRQAGSGEDLSYAQISIHTNTRTR